LRELVARVRVILKRQSIHNLPSDPNTPTFTVDEAKRRIEFCQVELELTTYEYGILSLLLSSPERVFTREQLMQAVWSTPEESFDRAVDTHIKTIRAKLRAIDVDDQSITTHRGVGYSIKLARRCES
jgi:two-component system catabolic regulation response regulator CreB